MHISAQWPTPVVRANAAQVSEFKGETRKLAPFRTLPYPRPMKGIVVAITVMNWTLASSGRLAIYTTASATCWTFIRGSTIVVPFACGTPCVIRSVISVAAFPISICPQAISKFRQSSEMLFVSPVIACLVAV